MTSRPTFLKKKPDSNSDLDALTTSVLKDNATTPGGVEQSLPTPTLSAKSSFTKKPATTTPPTTQSSQSNPVQSATVVNDLNKDDNEVKVIDKRENNKKGPHHKDDKKGTIDITKTESTSQPTQTAPPMATNNGNNRQNRSLKQSQQLTQSQQQNTPENTTTTSPTFPKKEKEKGPREKRGPKGSDKQQSTTDQLSSTDAAPVTDSTSNPHGTVKKERGPKPVKEKGDKVEKDEKSDPSTITTLTSPSTTVDSTKETGGRNNRNKREPKKIDDVESSVPNSQNVTTTTTTTPTTTTSTKPLKTKLNLTGKGAKNTEPISSTSIESASATPSTTVGAGKKEIIPKKKRDNVEKASQSDQTDPKTADNKGDKCDVKPNTTSSKPNNTKPTGNTKDTLQQTNPDSTTFTTPSTTSSNPEKPHRERGKGDRGDKNEKGENKKNQTTTIPSQQPTKPTATQSSTNTKSSKPAVIKSSTATSTSTTASTTTTTTSSTTSATTTSPPTLSPSQLKKAEKKAQRKAAALAIATPPPQTKVFAIPQSPDHTRFSPCRLPSKVWQRLDRVILNDDNVFPATAVVQPGKDKPQRPSVLTAKNLETPSLKKLQVQQTNIFSSSTEPMRKKHFPVELYAIYERNCALLERINTTLVKIYPSLWKGRSSNPSFPPKYKTEICELLQAFARISRLLIRMLDVLMEFNRGSEAVGVILRQFKDHTAVVEHLKAFLDKNALLDWPVLTLLSRGSGVHKTQLNKDNILSYGEILKGAAGVFLPFQEYTIDHFSILRKKILVNFEKFKTYCRSSEFSQFVAKSPPGGKPTPASTTATITSQSSTTSSATSSTTTTTTSTTTPVQPLATTLITPQIDLSLFADSAPTSFAGKDIAAVDPRYFGYSTSNKITLAGLPPNITLPQLHAFLRSTSVVPLDWETTQSNDTDNKASKDGKKGSSQQQQQHQYPQYDRCWIRPGNSYHNLIVDDQSSQTSTNTKNNNSKLGGNGGGSSQVPPTTAFITFSTYRDLLRFHHTFDKYECFYSDTMGIISGNSFTGARKNNNNADVNNSGTNNGVNHKDENVNANADGNHNTNQQPSSPVNFTHQYLGVKRFVLSTQLPISSYVPLNATFDNGLLYDFTEFDLYNKTHSQQNTTTGLSSTAQSFIPSKSPITKAPVSQYDLPLNQNESSLLTQTKWLTTLHFRDFLSNVLTEVKNVTETNNYNQFSKLKSNSSQSSPHQQKLLGSAALVQELEIERANKRAQVQEEEMAIKKLKLTSRGRKELKKKLHEQKLSGVTSLQGEFKNDPLNGLSAAFGYGLGVGRLVDVDEMNLPIVDQLLAMSVENQRKQQQTTNRSASSTSSSSSKRKTVSSNASTKKQGTVIGKRK